MTSERVQRSLGAKGRSSWVAGWATKDCEAAAVVVCGEDQCLVLRLVSVTYVS